MSAWTFDKDYKNLEQVRPFLASFKRRLAELEAKGEYRYNDSFIGHIPEIADLDAKATATAIYLLQRLEYDEAFQARYAALLAEGFELLHRDAVTAQPVKFAVVIDAYRDHAKFSTHEQARVVRGSYGCVAILPKGNRTHGYPVQGQLLVRAK